MSRRKRRPSSPGGWPWLFAVALFTGAALLFMVQPLAARLALPLVGGAPGTWTTCMLFFQAVLLAAYLYAHATTVWLGDRRQAVLHLVVLLLPALVLPLAWPARWSEPGSTPPALWLLIALAISVGLPFFAVATTSPLLQRWFSATGDPAGRDPYFLYSASNLGSLVGLLAYPFLMEPALDLPRQGWAWTSAYGVFVLLVAACAVHLWPSPKEQTKQPTTLAPTPAISWRRRLRWLLLAFVPSSLLLSVTTTITSDLAPVPLLWVSPLALYLLTFVLAFSRRPPVHAAFLARWLPLAALIVVIALLSEATEPAIVLVPLHLIVFTWAALFCHTSLAEDRPHASRLTELYLWIAVGGVLGGIVNGLVAPVLFRSLVEYPLVLVLLCALRPAPDKQCARPGWLDVALPAGLAAVTAALVLGAQRWGLPPGPQSVAIMFAVPTVVCYTFLAHPVRFALGLGALLLAGGLYHGVHGSTEFRDRSFFGTHRVTLDPTGQYRMLVHGNTVHGQQALSPARRHEPLTYYHRTAPIGKVFEALQANYRLGRVGVVGLGAGALCCYAQPGQEWTFFEIDSVVVTIACHSGLFTFWQDCAVRPELVEGDARLMLARSSARFDLLVIDAFSSDAVPIHLLTREALALYREHLTENGVLALNVSNRYLDLVTLLGDLAADARPAMACYVMEDRDLGDDERAAGKAPSQWVVLARDRKALAPVLRSGNWIAVKPRPGGPIWTDAYSNILGILKFG